MIWFFWIIFGIVLTFGFVVFRGAPYVPSHRRQVMRAFKELRPLDKTDVIVDAGSGDGIVLRLASLQGAKAVGYELNPLLVLISKVLSRHDSRVRVKLGDFWQVSLPEETTLIYGFMVERDMRKLAKKLQREADRLGKSFDFICYGSSIPGKEPVKRLGAHHLYRFEPLQRDKA